MLTISLVSHGHAEFVNNCLRDLIGFQQISRIVLTLNIPETGINIPVSLASRTLVIKNQTPKGFGENHNAAFNHCETELFCVLNPDVRCNDNPFPGLIERLNALNAAVIAPAVLSPQGRIEDSARHFPSPLSLFVKAMGGSDGRYPYTLGMQAFPVDWVAGMFMLFRAVDYRSIKGFDEGFFLYYEDVDICVRLWRNQRSVFIDPSVQVIHDAQRASRRNFKHMRWHVKSFFRYLLKRWFGRK